jgi:hypothetical protein
MDNELISIDDPHPFNAEDWIGQKKKYSKVPYFVREACSKAFAIPAAQVAKLFPGPDITVADLLKKELPPRSSAIISSKPESWFSKDMPHTNLEHYFARPIPNDTFVDELHKSSGQAWLDGAKSIVDQRFNDGEDRVPLCIIEYWKQMGQVAKGRAAWRNCQNWMAVNPEARRSEETECAFEDARAFLPGLGWNTPVSSSQGLTTLTFASLLGTDWIGGSTVQLMVDQLSERLRTSDQVSSTLIAGPEFARALVTAMDNGSSYSKSSTPLLSRYEAHQKNKGVENLYFPANVNANHWIAVHINFKRREYSYGEILRVIIQVRDTYMEFRRLIERQSKRIDGCNEEMARESVQRKVDQ